MALSHKQQMQPYPTVRRRRGRRRGDCYLRNSQRSGMYHYDSKIIIIRGRADVQHRVATWTISDTGDIASYAER